MFWQYSDSGELGTVPVDLDRFNGGPENLDLWLHMLTMDPLAPPIPVQKPPIQPGLRAVAM